MAVRPIPLEDQLKLKYQEIKKLSDNIPSQLARKITVNSEALLIIGKLHAASVYEYGKARSQRKMVYGQTMVETSGTGPVKEGTAEVASAPYADIEKKAEADMVAWKNTYEATIEIINALKLELRVLMEEYGQGGRSNAAGA